MSLTRAIVHASREDPRWEGTPCCHMVDIDGEPLLVRTVRQFRDLGAEVYTTGHEVPGAVQVKPLPNPALHEAEKYLQVEEWWNAEGRTLHLYGDTCYSDGAVRTMMDEGRRSWTMYGRGIASTKTGKPWPEYFGHAFWPEQWGEERRVLGDYLHAWEAGTVKQHNGGIDQFWKARFPDGEVVVNDWTEDFDFWRDYATWKVMRAGARAAGESV